MFGDHKRPNMAVERDSHKLRLWFPYISLRLPLTSTLNLMYSRILIAVIVAWSPSVSAAQCNVTPKSLAGNWESVGRWAFFEQMSFQTEGETKRFDSWLHERPEISNARWQLNECTLTIQSPSDKAEAYKINLRHGKLVMTDRNGKTSSTYRRIKEGK
jgi:hypothetical protein